MKWILHVCSRRDSTSTKNRDSSVPRGVFLHDQTTGDNNSLILSIATQQSNWVERNASTVEVSSVARASSTLWSIWHCVVLCSSYQPWYVTIKWQYGYEHSGIWSANVQCSGCPRLPPSIVLKHTPTNCKDSNELRDNKVYDTIRIINLEPLRLSKLIHYMYSDSLILQSLLVSSGCWELDLITNNHDVTASYFTSHTLSSCWRREDSWTYRQKIHNRHHQRPRRPPPSKKHKLLLSETYLGHWHRGRYIGIVFIPIVVWSLSYWEHRVKLSCRPLLSFQER